MLSEIDVDRRITWQPSLLDGAEPDYDPTLGAVERHDLGRGAWVDVVAGWVSGADALFDLVYSAAPWRAYERPMYDRIVPAPGGWRCAAGPTGPGCSTRWRPASDGATACACRPSPPTSTAYGGALGGLHGDPRRRHRADAVVAILPLGATRTLLLRPDGGGPSRSFPMRARRPPRARRHLPAHLRALRAQRAHAGPRISVMFRQRGGN